MSRHWVILAATIVATGASAEAPQCDSSVVQPANIAEASSSAIADSPAFPAAANVVTSLAPRETDSTLRDTTRSPIEVHVTSRPSILGQVVTGLISLGVAIVAFLLTRRRERQKAREEREERYWSLLKVVATEVRRNLDLECQIDVYWTAGLRPSFDLSMIARDNVFKELTSVSRTPGLLASIMNCYFEFTHINSRLEQMRILNQQSPRVATTERETQEMAAYSSHIAYEAAAVRKLARNHVQATRGLFNAISTELAVYGQDDGFASLDAEYLLRRYEALKQDRDVAAQTHRAEEVAQLAPP